MKKNTNNKKTLTKKQQEIMMYIKNYTLLNGIAPTIREIGQAVSLSSSSTVHGHLRKLERDGHLKRTEGARGIRILNPEYSIPFYYNGLPVPVVKELAGTDTVYNRVNIEEYLSVPEKFAKISNSLAFYKVRDNTMKDFDLQPGDCILVKFTDSAEDGKISVILDNGPRLLPPGETTSEHIIGVVIGYYRMFSR